MEDEKPQDDAKSSEGGLSVQDALKMYEEYKNYWAENYRQARIDLKMAAGDFAAHYGDGWDAKYTTPTGPMVVDNELPQYIHQVTNDIRQNVPSLKALPLSEGDIETGEVIAGLFRTIEYQSHADEVCDTAAEYAVTCSIGFMGIDHDYVDDTGELQEILFKTIPDPLSEFLDPASVEFDGRDSNGHVSLVPINKKEFERQHKGKRFVSFTDPRGEQEKTESIILAQIFIREFSGENGKKITVRRYLFSGAEMLVETTFPGKYIPRVPIYGQVMWIDGKRVLQSLIRQARSPQRRLNHMLSKESQLLAQAPIAPILAAEGTLVNERRQWQIPGLENALEYRLQDLDGNPAPPPIRLQPPGASAGFLEAIASAKEAIKASMGIYNAGLGKREGDASGVALKQLDRSGDVATFHYPDNVRRSYAHMGEIAVDMMPIIYDTARIEQILTEEQDVKMVGINGAPMQEGQKRPFDLTKGKYRVRVTTGASYTTRRQEEAVFLQEAFKADPALMQIGGDILFKSMDSPGSQAMAARMKKMLPPQLQDDAPQQDPKVAQLEQVLQQGQQLLQQTQQELAACQQELKSKQMETQAKVHDTDTKAQIELAKQALERDKLLLLDKQLDIQAREVELKYPPRNDTEQQILQHSLDEQAADNQLQRDLLGQAITTAMQPQEQAEDTEGAQAAQ